MQKTVPNRRRDWPARAAAAMAAGSGRWVEAAPRAARLAVLAALLGTAGVLAARRLAGALVAPLPPAVLVGAGIVVAALAWVARSPARRASAGHGGIGARRWLARRLPTVAGLAVALSLSVPGSGWFGLTALWSMILLGELLADTPARMPSIRRPRRRPPQADERRRTAQVDPPQAPTPHPPAPHATPSPPPPSVAVPSDEVLQQLTRRRVAGGAEELTGWLRVPFATGQRTENVHVAFCPPFAAAPQLSVAQLDGPEARIKTAQLLPYGARLDLKLSAPAKQCAPVLLEFTAWTEPQPELEHE